MSTTNLQDLVEEAFLRAAEVSKRILETTAPPTNLEWLKMDCKDLPIDLSKWTDYPIIAEILNGGDQLIGEQTSRTTSIEANGALGGLLQLRANLMAKRQIIEDQVNETLKALDDTGRDIVFSC